MKIEKLFGKTSNFAIKYSFEKNDYDDSLPDFCLELWVKEKQLMSYSYNDSKHTYFGKIQYIVDWMYSEIENILGYDPFPLPVPNADINTMLKYADEFESDNVLEDDLWYIAKSRWIFKHCWFSVREESIMPCIYFLRRKNVVEIAWNNHFWIDDGVFFEYDIGHDEIDYISFSNVLISFMQDIAEILKKFGCNLSVFNNSIIG